MKSASWIGRVRNHVWPRMGPKRYGRYVVRRIERMSAYPHGVAAGVAAGAAVSVYPLIGFHFIIGFVIAFVTRGNMVAAALGTALGNPITFPFFFSLSYHIGRWILPGHQRAADAIMRGNDIDHIMASMISQGLSDFWPVWKTMMVGALPISFVVYAAFYTLVRWFAGRTSARKRLNRERRAESVLSEQR